MKKIGRKILMLSIIVLGACEAVFLEDISDRTVKIVAPSDNAQVGEGMVNFLWESMEDATKYQLQIAKPTFSNASQVILDTTISKNSFNHDLIIGTYEWRVRAKNSEYATEYTTHNIEVINTDISEAQVKLLLPEENTVSNESSQKLTWEELSSATEYRVQIWQPDENGTNVKDVIVTDNFYTQNFEDGEFVWKVRPQSDSQNGKYVSRTITIDSTKPNTPESTSPANGESQTNTTVNFSWTRADIAGTQEVDSLYVFTDTGLTNLSFKTEGVNKGFTKENMEKNTYYWYVQAFDKAGNESDKSSTFTFTIN